MTTNLTYSSASRGAAVTYRLAWVIRSLLVGLVACSATLAHKPSLDDFVAGDRDAVAAMLLDTAEKFWSPFWALPGSREVTCLIVCRIETVCRFGSIRVKCLSAAPLIDLEADSSLVFTNYLPDWAHREFGVSPPELAVDEVRTCVVHGTGLGGGLWKYFLLFAGPSH